MTRIIVSTSNIMAGGPAVIRKPGVDRSNLEFVNSLRSNFVAAQEDYSPQPSLGTTGNDQDKPLNHSSSQSAPLSLWTWRRGSDYFVPRIDWSLAGLEEERNQYDITVKLFYLPGAAIAHRAEHTNYAVKFVLRALGIESIDLLIVSFPGMSFDGDCEWEADRKNSDQGNDEEEIATWPALEKLHRQGVIKRLGISEFGSEKLSRFLAKVHVRPQVDQINVKDCCNVPPPLIKLAKSEGIELLTHNDCTDILPSGTLRELLGQGANGAGVLSETKRGLENMKGDLTPQWVIKYTAVVRNRGVIENKGYFAAAELKD